MNKLEEELKLHIQMKLDESNKSSIENAQKENTIRMYNFIYGVVIWFISLSILSYLQKSFHLFTLITILTVDILINLFGKYNNLDLALLLKIRLSAIYVIIIIICIIIEWFFWDEIFLCKNKKGKAKRAFPSYIF